MPELRGIQATPEVKEEWKIAYTHYLHHKYFEVNYADGVFPLDRWFGSFHDGSPEADEAMKRRRLESAGQ